MHKQNLTMAFRVLLLDDSHGQNPQTLQVNVGKKTTNDVRLLKPVLRVDSIEHTTLRTWPKEFGNGDRMEVVFEMYADGEASNRELYTNPWPGAQRAVGPVLLSFSWTYARADCDDDDEDDGESGYLDVDEVFPMENIVEYAATGDMSYLAEIRECTWEHIAGLYR